MNFFYNDINTYLLMNKQEKENYDSIYFIKNNLHNSDENFIQVTLKKPSPDSNSNSILSPFFSSSSLSSSSLHLNSFAINSSNFNLSPSLFFFFNDHKEEIIHKGSVGGTFSKKYNNFFLYLNYLSNMNGNFHNFNENSKKFCLNLLDDMIDVLIEAHSSASTSSISPPPASSLTYLLIYLNLLGKLQLNFNQLEEKTSEKLLLVLGATSTVPTEKKEVEKEKGISTLSPFPLSFSTLRLPQPLHHPETLSIGDLSELLETLGRIKLPYAYFKTYLFPSSSPSSSSFTSRHWDSMTQTQYYQLLVGLSGCGVMWKDLPQELKKMMKKMMDLTFSLESSPFLMQHSNEILEALKKMKAPLNHIKFNY